MEHLTANELKSLGVVLCPLNLAHISRNKSEEPNQNFEIFDYAQTRPH